MKRAAIALFGLVFAVFPPTARSDPGAAALAAAVELDQAAAALAEVDGARDRVRALSDTIRAYESGLEAMREGLRRVTIEESRLARRLAAREQDVARLLGVIQTIETSPPPILMLHPSGPVGSARSGMMLADVTPALQARATELRRDLDQVRTLRLLQENAARTLGDGLAGIQRARAELSQAIANRTDLPRRFTEDPVRTAILISSVETLSGFASGLSELTDESVPPTAADITARKGNLPLPVQGIVLHRAGESDAAGVKRDGIIIATRPRALITIPVAATIRYRGPLLDLGNVVILEPQADLIFIFSGLAEVFGETGEVLPAGSPVGLMGGEIPEIGAILSLSGDDTGTDRSETLYIEVRQGGSPVDPETWFRTDKDG